ncbi:hypothetical protein ACFP1Z_23265 [Streptomyces gamaensis]|uniref:Uncharacterized protein n=1 Tax=Streptomyces gamaensis TaxID=1763542 RepID=A0ABW0Z4L8_9ACTN
MEWISPEEECALLNARELSPLWSLLADWSESEDEEVWRRHIPVFTRIISRWSQEKYIVVHSGPEWPACEAGDVVAGSALERLLADPATWEYQEDPVRVIGLAPGENFTVLSSPPQGS